MRKLPRPFAFVKVFLLALLILSQQVLIIALAGRRASWGLVPVTAEAQSVPGLHWWAYSDFMRLQSVV